MKSQGMGTSGQLAVNSSTQQLYSGGENGPGGSIKRKRSPSPNHDQHPAVTHKVPQEMAYSVKMQFLKCMSISLFILNFAELVEDLNFERRRMARDQRMRQEEARKHQQMAIQKEQQREKEKQEAEMKKRMKRRRKRRIRRDGSGGSGGNNPVPGSGSEEEFFKGGRGSSNEDDYYYDEYESDRYSGDEGMLSSGVEDDDNYFRRSKGVLFEEKGAKGPTRTAAANRERLAQTQSHNFKGNKTMSNNNNSADDLNYSPEDGTAAKKQKRKVFDINLGQIEKEKVMPQNTERVMYDSRGQLESDRG